jgi:hypothetical protein
MEWRTTRTRLGAEAAQIETPIPGAMRRGGMVGSGFYAQTGGGGCSRGRTTGECGSRSPLSENRVNPQRGGPTSLGGGGAEAGPTLGVVSMGSPPGAMAFCGKKQAKLATAARRWRGRNPAPNAEDV